MKRQTDECACRYAAINLDHFSAMHFILTYLYYTLILIHFLVSRLLAGHACMMLMILETEHQLAYNFHSHGLNYCFSLMRCWKHACPHSPGNALAHPCMQCWRPTKLEQLLFLKFLPEHSSTKIGNC